MFELIAFMQCLCNSGSPASASALPVSASDIFIVQCYASTRDVDCPAKDEFYTQLAATQSDIQRGNITFLMGDCNEKIGSTNSDLERTIGI